MEQGRFHPRSPARSGRANAASLASAALKMAMDKKRGRHVGSHHSPLISAVVAEAGGRIIELSRYVAVGMAGKTLVPLTRQNTRPRSHGTELMLLPDRFPIVFEPATHRFVALRRHPHSPDQPVFAVAAFNSPGHMITLAGAWQETPGAAVLPLFSYGAVGYGDGGFRTAALLVDAEPRQDLRRMPLARVKKGIARMQNQLPGNRLRAHLETCALVYGCPAGKNFFLGRYEAPLPASMACNARCLGCISLQPDGRIPCSQNRIGFTPTPDEIAAVALAHIGRVPKAVVSFGQGCEGDPLLAAAAIEPAIGLIRRQTAAGTININTNAGLPKVLERLLAKGLDSVRVSINSVRADCYQAYFRPRGYGFADVVDSIGLALERGVFVSINYLNSPGFTDSIEEFEALMTFLARCPIDMIQWRNLNFDPRRYHQAMARASASTRPIGMANLLGQVRQRFPQIRFGYFNPPKESFARG
jgi:pyruvate-formate lyase-activating enzyme